MEGLRIQRSAAGFSASGPNLYVWQEDERSIRSWLEELGQADRRSDGRPRGVPGPGAAPVDGDPDAAD